MQKIYINIIEGKFFKSNGSMLRDGEPRLSYKRRDKIAFQLCTETPNANGEGVNPDEWTKVTSYANIPGVSALLTVDNDFLRWYRGALTQDVASGSVSEISVRISGVAQGSIATTGTIRLYDELGNVTPLKYDNVVVISGEQVKLLLADGSFINNSFAAGVTVDVPAGAYIQAPLNYSESDIANGLFVFDLVAYSAKLKAALEYSSQNSAPGSIGMELLIFQTTDDETQEIGSYYCDTASIRSTMAEANPNAALPETEKDVMIGLLYSQIRLLYGENPLEMQFSVDGVTNWHETQTAEDRFFRQRIANLDAAWSDAVMMAAGVPGKDGIDGIDGHTPERGVDYWTDADKAEIKAYVDEAILSGAW